MEIPSRHQSPDGSWRCPGRDQHPPAQAQRLPLLGHRLVRHRRPANIAGAARAVAAKRRELTSVGLRRGVAFSCRALLGASWPS
jgi:hypothetical protein